MTSTAIAPQDQKPLAYIALITGLILTAGGLFGVWLQGIFYEGTLEPYTVDEVRLAFIMPTIVTTIGCMFVATVTLVSPLTEPWTKKRRVALVALFASLVLGICIMCGHLAGSRVSKWYSIHSVRVHSPR